MMPHKMSAPIAGTTGPISRHNSHEFKLWRGSQQSTFQWSTTPPLPWKPISVLFFSLIESLRSHTEGSNLSPSQIYERA
jgi:hypothetical protein